MATTINALIAAYGEAQFSCGDWDSHHCDEPYEAVHGRAEAIRKVLAQALEFYCTRVDEPILHLEVPGSFRDAVKQARAFMHAYRPLSIDIWFNPCSGDFEQGPRTESTIEREDLQVVGYVDPYGYYVHQDASFKLDDVPSINTDLEVHT